MSGGAAAIVAPAIARGAIPAGPPTIDRLTFPVDFFRWNSASALISSEKGQHDVAQAAARAALEGASKTDSGFRYHRSIGLVGGGDADLLKQITKLAALS